jgi:catechol 2,3-dioxygenase-like lactoylglutathione lyase family enzyme
MRTKKVVPLFTTESLPETQDFYTRHLGFRVEVEMPGYVELANGDAVRLAFMQPMGEDGVAARGAGLYYCLEVDDVDAEHRRLAAEGVVIQEEPADKPWGDRALTLADPSGITVYLHHPIGAAVAPEPAVR